MSNQWTHGFCSCFENAGLCIFTFILPCVQFGRNVSVLGENCVLYGALFLIPVANIVMGTIYRGKIRETKGIEGNGCGDFVKWLFCPLCALVQEAREVEDIKPQAMARE